MCSICASVLGSSVLHHEPPSCPLSKSLWCEFCATNGHTPLTCPDRIEREASSSSSFGPSSFGPSSFGPSSFGPSSFGPSSFGHPESGPTNVAVFTIPQSDKAVRSVLKLYGGSLSGIQTENRVRLKKILTSKQFNYKVV
jgi:hypothetical protein